MRVIRRRRADEQGASYRPGRHAVHRAGAVDAPVLGHQQEVWAPVPRLRPVLCLGPEVQFPAKAGPTWIPSPGNKGGAAARARTKVTEAIEPLRRGSCLA